MWQWLVWQWRVRWSGVLTFAAISEVLGVRVGGRRVDVADMDHQAAKSDDALRERFARDQRRGAGSRSAASNAQGARAATKSFDEILGEEGPCFVAWICRLRTGLGGTRARAPRGRTSAWRARHGPRDRTGAGRGHVSHVPTPV